MRIFTSKGGRFLSVILILIVGASISLGLFFLVRGWEEQRLAYEFRMRAHDLTQVVRDSIEDHLQVATTLVDFFRSSQFVSRQEFQTFTQNILKDYPDILALSWIPVVPGSERAAFEAKVRQDEISDFEIREEGKPGILVRAASREQYFPILYIEPLASNRFILGYDEASDSVRREAFEKARDTGKATATGRIQLKRTQAGGYACRVFFPIYQRGVAPTTLKGRREEFLGATSVLFLIDQVTEAALKKATVSGIDFAIYDQSAFGEDRSLYFHPSRLKGNSPGLEKDVQAKKSRGLIYNESFAVADRNWVVACQPNLVFWFLRQNWQAYAVLIAGLLMTVILGLYIFTLMNRQAEVRSLVEARTTELRRANQEIRKSRDFSELLFKVVPSAIFTVGKDHRILSFNRRAEEITGFSAKEVVGQDCRVFAIEPCEHQCGVFSEDVVKPIVSRECLIRTKQGKILQVSKNADLLRNVHGEVIGAIESFEDITERKAAEKALKSSAEEWQRTFDSINDLIFIQDNNHVIHRVNAAFAKSLGKRPEEIIGRRCFELMHGMHSPWPTCPFEETKKDGLAHTVEVDDPKVGVPLLVTTSPIFDEKGTLAGSVHIAKDITEFKKIEQEQRRAAGLKIAFTSMVSHELRTPLTAIKEGISILADGVAGEVLPQQREFLEIARRNVDRLARLINNVLDFQKLDSGHMEFYFQENDVNATVQEVYQTMVPLTAKKGLAFDLKLDENLPEVKYDKDKITQVLANLVNNAIKFTEKGAISIATTRQGNSVQVSVRDSGPGIRKEDIPRLFRHFEQLESLQERKTGGTGLGLAISRQIIEQHKGKIWAESELGQGAAFYFILPIDPGRA